MPPRKTAAKTTKKVEPVVSSSSESESEYENVKPTKSVKSMVTTVTTATAAKRPVAMVKFNSSVDTDKSNLSDRLQLAQAINNLVFKGDAFTNALEQLHELTNERLTELDLQIESKQQEFVKLTQKIESEHEMKTKFLESEYDMLEKKLENKYEAEKDELEKSYENRSKELELNFKHEQIETNQKLREYKLKACKELATENGMLLVEKSDNDKLLGEKSALANELKQLKDKYDTTLKAEVSAEKNKFDALLKQEKTTMDLTYKMQTADVNAKVVQLEKEVTVLNKMIDNLKNELAEQRNLTKDVASSASRSAINQSFGNK